MAVLGFVSILSVTVTSAIREFANGGDRWAAWRGGTAGRWAARRAVGHSRLDSLVGSRGGARGRPVRYWGGRGREGWLEDGALVLRSECGEGACGLGDDRAYRRAMFLLFRRLHVRGRDVRVLSAVACLSVYGVCRDSIELCARRNVCEFALGLCGLATTRKSAPMAP